MMGLIIVALAAIFLPCLPVRAAGLMDCVLSKPSCGRDLIGKRMWIVVPRSNPNTVTICPTPPPHNYSACREVRTGSFTIKRVIPAPNFGREFVVKLPSGSIAYVSASDSIFLSTFDPVAAAKASRQECIRRGQPKIGMTIAQAIKTCWGKPRRILKITTASGVREDLVYGRGQILRFENGKLTAIAEMAGQ